MVDAASDGTAEQTPRTGRLISDDVWGILCIFGEARGETYEGMIAVGNVVRNRTRRHFSSDGTVVGTVTSPYQFSWMNTTDGQRTRVLSASWEDDAMSQCVHAWFESEYRQEVPDDTLWYHASEVSPGWAKAHSIVLVKEIGRHRFFKESQRI